MMAMTLTFSVLFSLMFMIVGSIVGWIAKEYVIQRDAKFIPTHPEMFDENGTSFLMKSTPLGLTTQKTLIVVRDH